MPKKKKTPVKRRRGETRTRSYRYRVIIELLAAITLGLHLIEKALH
jgi:hypothetical protein